MESKIWKERLESVQAIAEQINEQGDRIDAYIDAIIYCLDSTPGWKESNAQVLSKMFEVAGLLSKQSKYVLYLYFLI